MPNNTERATARTPSPPAAYVRAEGPRDSVSYAPPTPPSPEEGDTNDAKGSRKREREVSVEPATPKTDELAAPGSSTERRSMPVPKKGRVKLGSTREEDDDANSANSAEGEGDADADATTPPPASPGKAAEAELATSPRFESNVRQISRKVSTMMWEEGAEGAPPSSAPDAVLPDVPESAAPAVLELEPVAEPTPPPATSSSSTSMANADTDPVPSEAVKHDIATSDPPPSAVPEPKVALPGPAEAEEQDKPLKRKIGDRLPSASVEEPPAKAAIEPAKRARDDAEEDVNPREKKRPTPPPEEHKDGVKTPESKPATSTSDPAAPQPKTGGFLAYASTSSPFASAKGPSVFGIKSTPSPSPLAGTSNGTASSLSSNLGRKLSPSPFASSHAFSSPNNTPAGALSSSPTGTKRSASGFEGFASAASPFAAVARSKSPTGALGRSKSPARRSTATSTNAFKSYVGSGVQSFAAPSPPVKKLRQDSGDEAEKPSKSVLGGVASNEGSQEGSEEEESDKQATFGERLRAKQEGDDTPEAEEEEKLALSEQGLETGEEEEDTIFQVRGKLYGLSEQNAWKERGTGLLKLNVRKSDGRGARLVMRKEAVYTLLLNVPLFKGMRCTLAQDPRYVRFSVIESSSTVHYNLRLSNAKVAGELIEEINANIPYNDDEEENAV